MSYCYYSNPTMINYSTFYTGSYETTLPNYYSNCNNLNGHYQQYTPKYIIQVEEIIGSLEKSTRRKPKVHKETINVSKPGKVKTLVRKLKTPEPDIIERTYIIKEEPDQIELVIEKPETPPPIVKVKEVLEKSCKDPVINFRIVRIPALSKSSIRKEQLLKNQC